MKNHITFFQTKWHREIDEGATPQIFCIIYMLTSLNLSHSILLLFGLLRLFQEDESQWLGSCGLPPSAYWGSLVHMPELHVIQLSSSHSQQVFHPPALLTL